MLHVFISIRSSLYRQFLPREKNLLAADDNLRDSSLPLHQDTNEFLITQTFLWESPRAHGRKYQDVKFLSHFLGPHLLQDERDFGIIVALIRECEMANFT